MEARSPLSPCSRVASAELGAGMAKARWAMAPYLSLYSRSNEGLTGEAISAPARGRRSGIDPIVAGQRCPIRTLLAQRLEEWKREAERVPRVSARARAARWASAERPIRQGNCPFWRRSGTSGIRRSATSEQFRCPVATGDDHESQVCAAVHQGLFPRNTSAGEHPQCHIHGCVLCERSLAVTRLPSPQPPDDEAPAERLCAQ